jgi:BirA family transcriptional regulator, biotin operon repressor / biotin---[acetyl-CoA-carboxylase] ligase
LTLNLPENLLASRDIPDDVRSELSRVASRLDAVARRVYWLETAGSTNDLAARLADAGAEEGTVVVAEAQTAGRGRMGRVWHSPPGAGLYVSILLKPSPTAGPPHPRTPAPAQVRTHAPTHPYPPASALLTLAAGVALADGVQAATGLGAEIKWPNDLVVARRKLAGILAEAAAQGGALQFIVLGFGLNLRPAVYPPELAQRVTSIEAETNRPADRAVILAEILAGIAERYADLRQGRFDAILGAWRERAPSLRGSAVEWDSGGAMMRGRAEDVDDTGALLVRAGGNVHRLVAGEVRWV